MKNMFSVLKVIVSIIAFFVFVSGLVLTALGVYDFVKIFKYLGSNAEDNAARLMAVALLHAVDFFLVAIVFFVLSLGIILLFYHVDASHPLKLPEWLKIEDFLQLKVILWEAILTTMVVSHVANLVEKKISGAPTSINDLLIPAAVLVISLSLYFVKKGEK